jgi:S-adenosylmethionine hydrolase
MPPIVALLTDFGSQDHYAGAVKGAVLSACPEVLLVDVTHGLPAHDVDEAAFALAAAYRAFPARTVFLAVVDPGVGSERRGLAVGAGGYLFVGPDNGLFTLVLSAHPEARIHALTNAGLFRHEVSPVFHARDVFGPVAGHLARGLALDEVGPAIDDPVLLPIENAQRRGDGDWEATVVHVDGFGNLTTDLTRDVLDEIVRAAASAGGEVVVVADGEVLPLARTYADVAEGEGCALAGSSGRLEVAVNRGRASERFNAAKGSTVRVRTIAVQG